MKCNTKECLLRSNCFYFIAISNDSKQFKPPLVISDGGEHACIKYITIDNKRKLELNK